MPSSPGSSPTLSRSRSGAGSVGLASPSKRVNADAALQQLRAELLARSIDSTVPQPGHTGSKVRLPLDVFDNRDLERDTPMGWVSAATSRYAKRPNAAVLVADEAGAGEWRLGRVFQWEAQSALFSVQLADAGGRVIEDTCVQLPRLCVMFLGERVDEFATRVADAHRMRDECEAALLFRFYVRSMPTSDVRTLNELQVQQLLTRAQSARLRSADAGALIEEVRLEYAHAMNGLLLRDGLRRPPLRDKVRADLLLPPPPPPPPELGVVSIEENDFVGATASFLATSNLVMAPVVLARSAAQYECLQLGRLSLFNLEITRALRLEDFEQIQAQHASRLMTFLGDAWQARRRRRCRRRPPLTRLSPSRSCRRVRSRRWCFSGWPTSTRADGSCRLRRPLRTPSRATASS